MKKIFAMILISFVILCCIAPCICAEDEINSPILTLQVEKLLAEDAINYVEVGDRLIISALAPDDVTTVYYAWDEDELKAVESVKIFYVTVPEEYADGYEHILYVKGVDAEDNNNSFQKFKMVVLDTRPRIKLSVSISGNAVDGGETLYVHGGEKLTIEAEGVNAEVAMIGLLFDDSDCIAIYGSSVTIQIPLAEAGTTKTLNIQAAGLNLDSTEQVNTPWVAYKLIYN